MFKKSKLAGLKKYTTIVADTGDIEAIQQYKPQDATTNPSLIFKAAQKEKYRHLVEDAIEWAHEHAKNSKNLMDKIIVKLFVNFGSEILKIIPGRVSTEVDARLSFDVEGSIQRAHEYIDLYQQKGIDKERILIKLASTWEGMLAAEKLEKEGIHCNMTLMFHKIQAAKAAEVNATLISPFVGRIHDWQKEAEKRDKIPADEDLGVKSVTEIYHYYKSLGYKTQIMGASFRNIEEILHLAGCDLLTISPELLKELEETEGSVERRLDPTKKPKEPIKKISVDEKMFRWEICNSAMATDKLYEGIRKFTADTIKLEKKIEEDFLQERDDHKKRKAS